MPARPKALILYNGTVTILRHANAVEAADDSYEADKARDLSRLGRAQADERRERLRNPTYDLVLSSPAIRARKTAERVAKVTGSDVVLLPELYWSAGTEPTPKLGYEAAIRRAIPECFGDREQTFRLLISTHAVLDTALGRALLPENESGAHFKLAHLELEECEGFSVLFNEGRYGGLILHQQRT
ncbi:MAG TPA: histidine phosphatase family protein [Candidatus Paceibacterota bacterium]|nr:histidine phosphatase family protein [Candidatus Paceibacterota bacterium]